MPMDDRTVLGGQAQGYSYKLQYNSFSIRQEAEITQRKSSGALPTTRPPLELGNVYL
jgi:hypothetical protein